MSPITINPSRIDLDEAYLQMAEVWAWRSKANRLQVAALIVRDRQIISDGYNGMPSGTPPEDEVCEYHSPEGELKTKSIVLHAESNAILKIARNGGGGADGATMYTTHSPCVECAKLIRQAGIARLVFRNTYRDTSGLELLKGLGVEITDLGKT